ncbi:unnamed protein product, partial [Callosobruchus maculatus]
GKLIYRVTGNSTTFLQEVIEGLKCNRFNPPYVIPKTDSFRDN